MAKIYLKFNTAVIREYELKKDETTFGRKPGNDIVIENPAVSGFHGKIVKDGEAYAVVDVNSTNGTYLNGHKVTRSPLKDRDQITVARHILEFVDETPARERVQAESTPNQQSKQGLPTPPLKPPVSLQVSLTDSGHSPAPPPSAPAPQTISQQPQQAPTAKRDGVIKIISGGASDQTEIPIKNDITYIGTGDKALVKIKGFLAPDLAAVLSRKPEGFLLKAVKKGYPVVNDNKVEEQVLLDNGALIQIGGTSMVFYYADAKKGDKKTSPA